MTTALANLTQTLAQKLDMGDNGEELFHTLKATAFKGDVSNAQMTALLVVANQYGLNPWTREIYAFPDKHNGIVPVVGVDGWARIINSHPQFDGMDFEQDAESCTCIIYRKDRSHPIKVTEWMEECRRGTGPWQSHPRRMLRHKAMIQCARLAFGYGGIFDQDEAEAIAEHQVQRNMGRAEVVTPTHYPASDFGKNMGAWAKAVAAGKLTLDGLLAKVQTKGELTADQLAALHDEINDLKPQPDVTDVEPKPVVTYAQVADALHKAQSIEALHEAADLIGVVADGQQREELTTIYMDRQEALEGAEA